MQHAALAHKIARLEHGRHICSFYRDFADQMTTLIGRPPPLGGHRSDDGADMVR